MVLTVRDAAKLINVPQKTVQNWIKENKIPYHRVGEQYFFERFELFRFAVNENLNTVGVLADDESKEDTCAFFDSLVRGGIFYDVGGTTKTEVLYNALKLVEGIDQTAIEPLFELFMAREELVSTGIGDGIAIPHARGPLIDYVDSPHRKSHRIRRVGWETRSGTVSDNISDCQDSSSDSRTFSIRASFARM